MSRLSIRAIAALAAVLGIFAGVAGAASAAPGQASIDHSEVSGHVLRLLVSVPGSAPIDLGSAATTLDGKSVTSTASDASASNEVSRTTVLALDTSGSMAGTRIHEAEKAARAYLSTVPANVRVGVVTFSGSVQVAVSPTLDRAAARNAIDHITLSRGTSLYDGVDRAVLASGSTGQRQVLLLSDGKDTTSTTLASAVTQVRSSGVRLDAVTLQPADAANAALSQLTAAGKGSMLNAADPTTLSAAYAKEATTLARQVLLTVTLPASQRAHDATVGVTLTAGGQTYTDSAYVQVLAGARTHATAAVQKPVPVSDGSGLPWMVALIAIAGIGVGIAVLAFVIIPPRREHQAPQSVEDQIRTYGATGTGARPGEAIARETNSIADQARDIAGRVLSNNRGLEARIEARLTPAGMSLKPSEWLLLHGAAIVGAGLLGVLLGAGNILLILLFLVFGAVIPWVFLGFKKSRRIKAFNAGIADTLQLISSSLSAGLSLMQAMDTVVREGTEPICSEFRRAIVETRLGVGIEDALDGVATRMESRDFAWVVMAIRIQREVGGNLAELLNTVAATLREREYLRRHVAALSAEGRLSAWILGGLPPLFLVYLILTRGSYVHPLFTTAIGILMCIAMAVMMTVGVFWMSKVTKVEI